MAVLRTCQMQLWKHRDTVSTEWTAHQRLRRTKEEVCAFVERQLLDWCCCWRKTFSINSEFTLLKWTPFHLSIERSTLFVFAVYSHLWTSAKLAVSRPHNAISKQQDFRLVPLLWRGTLTTQTWSLCYQSATKTFPLEHGMENHWIRFTPTSEDPPRPAQPSTLDSRTLWLCF